MIAPTPSATRSALRPHKELLIAWTLLLLYDDALHGYRLHQALVARGLDLQPTSLYRWLGKFERDRWVTSRWSEPIEGPRRHVYWLTPKGRRALHELSGLIAAMRDTYSTFLHTHEQALAQRAHTLDNDDVLGNDATSRRDPQLPADAATAATPAPLRPHKELLVGWLLLRLDIGATYGYDLRREFDAHGLSIDPAVMYRMLRKLETDKWVQSHWLAPITGPRRRLYRLTTRGRRNLDEIAGLITAIRNSHDAYLREHEHTRSAANAKAKTRDTSPPG